MKRGPQRTGVRLTSTGFTIVETMIVLAITGLLFVVIAATWAGRQRTNEFHSAANEIRSEIQQSITNVQNGYFPGNGGFSCLPGVNNLALVSPPPPTDKGTQGTNINCVYLGELLQFGNNTGTNDGYRDIPVAGLRDPSDPTDFPSLQPTTLMPSSSNDTMVDLSQLKSMQYGLTVASMRADSGGPQDVNAIAFLSRSGEVSGGNLQSGTQQIDLYAFRTVGGAVDLKNVSSLGNKLNQELLGSGTSTYYKNAPVTICFKSGGTDQYAIVTLGTGSRLLQPVLTIASSCG